MKYKETEYTELKSEVVKDLKKEVVAFANTRGGEIYIGVNDDGSVCGLENADEELQKISNMVRDSIKPDVTMFVDYKLIEENPSDIVQVKINKGSSRPYYLSDKGLKPSGVYIRQGTSSVPASDEMIRNMIIETDGRNYEEMRSLNQDLTFHDMEDFFSENQLTIDKSKMKAMHLIDEDDLFTNLALLLSDQNPFQIKVAFFQGEDELEFTNRKEIKGSLFRQYKILSDLFIQENPVKADFSGFQRIDSYGYPFTALREALLNMMIHRDYGYSDSSKISIFKDRIEMTSVGGLVYGMCPDDLEIGLSRLRNRNLADIFYRLKLIEAYGTGIPKIRAAYKDSFVKPQIIVTSNGFKVVLPNRNTVSLKMDDTENRIFTFVQQNHGITRNQAEELLNCSRSQAGKILKKMTEDGILLIYGKGRNVQYIASNSDDRIK